MTVTYVIPSSTTSANQNLVRIFKQSKAKQRGHKLSASINLNSVNISYGYLGLYANLVRQDFSSLATGKYSKMFILDHAFAPSSLKGDVFRLSVADTSLSTVLFNKKLITNSHEVKIKDHLLQLQHNQQICLSVPPISKSLIDDNKKVSLLVKASPVLSRLKNYSCNSLSNWLSSHHQKNSKTRHLIAIKNNEVVLTPDHSKIFSRKSNLADISLSYHDIAEVYVATSMIALQFILHSVPVYLSSIHPLYRLLGEYIPSLNPDCAMQLITDSITKTSISIANFGLLEEYLQRSVKYF